MNDNLNLEKHPINCKIYSSEFIYKKLFRELELDFGEDFYIIEPAVGTGNLFIPLIKDFLKYGKARNWSNYKMKKKLEKSFYAFDVDTESLEVLKKRLNKLVDFKVNWAIEKENIITIEHTKKATHIICNPPYILNRKLSNLQREKLKERYSTCRKGNFNILFAFFEYAVNSVSTDGKIAFITTNTYLNIKSAQSLRELLVDTNRLCKIYDFRSEKLFEGAEVNAAITVVKEAKKFQYFHSNVNADNLVFSTKYPNDKNYKTNCEKKKTGLKISDFFEVCGGIATLDNYFYFIQKEEIITLNNKYIAFKKKDKNQKIQSFQVEMELIKKVIRPSKINDNIYAVFPYKNNSNTMISFYELQEKYPMAFVYFSSNIKKDKTKTGFGRTQGFRNISGKKFIIPKICNEIKIIEDNTNALVYSGIYLTPKSNVNSNIIEKCISNLTDEKTWLQLKERMNNTSHGYFNISSTLIKELIMEGLENEES